ncbi:MAG: hypothetical protein ACXABY_18005 [Candidatus Thorarchaeota archaeon]
MCRTKLNEAEHKWHDALEASGLPDPEEERSRIIRMLTAEGARTGRIYSEEDAAEVAQTIEERKTEQFHKMMLRKYREKRQNNS